MGWGDRWQAIDPTGKSGGLLIGWGIGVTVCQILSTAYIVEVEFEVAEAKGKMWAIFVYASVKDKVRTEQWHELYIKSRPWGYRWILGGISMI